MERFNINMDGVATKPGWQGRSEVESCSATLCNRTVPRNGGKVHCWDEPHLMVCSAPDMDVVRAIVAAVWADYPACEIYCDNGTEFIGGQEYTD
jgi:hypothetical protein